MNLATQLATIFDYPLLHTPRFRAHATMPSLVFRLLLHSDIYLLLLSDHVSTTAGIQTMVLLLTWQDFMHFYNNKFHIVQLSNSEHLFITYTGNTALLLGSSSFHLNNVNDVPFVCKKLVIHYLMYSRSSCFCVFLILVTFYFWSNYRFSPLLGLG